MKAMIYTHTTPTYSTHSTNCQPLWMNICKGAVEAISYADGEMHEVNGKNKYEAVAIKICFDTNIAEDDNVGGVSY